MMGNKKTRFRRYECVESAILNLKELSNIFSLMNVKYWLQDGCLLGYLRENDFISHDTDLDIGIHINSITKELFDELDRNNFKLILTRGNVKDSLYIKLNKRNIQVDIFPYYTIDEDFFYHCAFDKNNNQINYIYKKFNTLPITFKNIKVQAPENVLYFVETKYGKDWKISNPAWNHITSPLNARKVKPGITTEDSMSIFNKWILTR